MIVQRQNSAYDRTDSAILIFPESAAISPLFSVIDPFGSVSLMKTIRRFCGIAPALLSLVCGAALCAILAVLVLGQSVCSAYYENLSLLSNAALLPFAAVLIALCFFLCHRLDGRAAQNERRSLLRLRLGFLAVLGVQLVIARCCWYKMGWDISVVYTTAEELARGLESSHPDYFNLCPNNAPITLLQYLPMRLAVRLGLAEPFIVLPCIDAVLLNLSAYFAVRCVQLLTQSRAAHAFAIALSIGWIALSPYILYPYTDSFAILFPVLAFYTHLRVRPPVLKWLLISLLCFFGASVKPTVLILLIALMLLGACRFLAGGDFSRAAWKRVMLTVLAMVIGMLPGKLWQNGATAYLAGSAKPEEQLSATHYLMLGMNGATFGGHSTGDVEFSTSFATLSERQSANLKRAWERVSERSLAENLRFFTVKAYKAYADGSFAAHTSFLELEVPKREDGLSAFLRSLYHKRGALTPYCQTLAQGVWLTVLGLCAAGCIRSRRNPAVAVLALTLLGLTAYLLLFEVWPRYLFLYAPVFVILAALALDKPLFSKR